MATFKAFEVKQILLAAEDVNLEAKLKAAEEKVRDKEAEEDFMDGWVIVGLSMEE